MRLNLFIAKSGAASRRGADILIKEGKVRVNGRIVKEPYFDVSGQDDILLRQQRLRCLRPVYILFNKPRGVTVTCDDPFASCTVSDIFSHKFRGIFPVGRLDKNSRGLLIMTNDGALCQKITHPKFEVEKEYELSLDRVLVPDDSRRLMHGIKNEGQVLRVRAVRIVRKGEKGCLCRVVIKEGKKRHLRRLFAALGYRVKDLLRIRIGSLCLGKLKSGQYSVVTRKLIEKALISNAPR